MNARYIVNRVITSLIILFVVITLIFILPRLGYDNPADPYLIGIDVDDHVTRQAVIEEYGFDKPVMIQYFKYLGRVFTLNFGNSYSYRQPVGKVMFSRIPWSLILSLSSMILSVALGILCGAISAKRRGKWQDKTLLRMSTISAAVPPFWIAMIFVMLFAFTIPIFPHSGAMTVGYWLNFNWIPFVIGICVTSTLTAVLYKIFKKGFIIAVLPLVGFFISILISIPLADTFDIFYHALLPVIVIASSSTIGYALMVRNSMITTVNEDYILTARAKGLPERTILFRHAFKNALLPMVTSVCMGLAGVFGGSVLIEKIFSWPGMGNLLLEANSAGDYALAQAIMIFFAVITIVCNLCADLVYHKLDPRVSVAK